jgi:hypothetical protein
VRGVELGHFQMGSSRASLRREQVAASIDEAGLLAQCDLQGGQSSSCPGIFSDPGQGLLLRDQWIRRGDDFHLEASADQRRAKATGSEQSEGLMKFRGARLRIDHARPGQDRLPIQVFLDGFQECGGIEGPEQTQDAIERHDAQQDPPPGPRHSRELIERIHVALSCVGHGTAEAHD